MSGRTEAVELLGLHEITEWVVLYGGEDDGERFVDRTHAEDRIEEIREQIADGQYDAEDYEPMTLATTTQLRSEWTTTLIPDQHDHQEDS